MMQSVWSVENTKEYWEKVVEDTDRFYRKYQTEFSKELALALANELERKAKHEAEQTTVQERMGIHFGRVLSIIWQMQGNELGRMKKHSMRWKGN